MAVSVVNFDTGPSTLPDVGELSYNGCVFSPLFYSNIAGKIIRDNAQRTTKLMEYMLSVDGYVTMPDSDTDIAPTMNTLRTLLTVQGGTLNYSGRGFDLSVNAGNGVAFGNAARDVAWGPVPELIEFQPLGSGRSAKVQWQVIVRVVEHKGAKNTNPLLQFNCETTVSYGEDYYSSLSIRGTMEIPMTKLIVGSRKLKTTIDDQRTQLDARIFKNIDMTRFRVVRRDYPISRDKRTMEFNIEVEELPYMDLPPDVTIARGTFSFKPATSGMGLCNWLCSLRASYVVAAGQPRRVAYLAFLALLRERMRHSVMGNVEVKVADFLFAPRAAAGKVPGWTAPSYDSSIPFWNKFIAAQSAVMPGNKRQLDKAWLIDFSGDEGLYLDSKTTSFSATWQLVTTFDRILQASGLWRKLPEEDANGKNLWATSLANVSGSVSWLPNILDASKDVIVDFGGG